MHRGKVRTVKASLSKDKEEDSWVSCTQEVAHSHVIEPLPEDEKPIGALGEGKKEEGKEKRNEEKEQRRKEEKEEKGEEGMEKEQPSKAPADGVSALPLLGLTGKSDTGKVRILEKE